MPMQINMVVIFVSDIFCMASQLNERVAWKTNKISMLKLLSTAMMCVRAKLGHKCKAVIIAA